jgi:hypothetical protein
LKKLAIVGTAPSSIHLAPYNNPDYEIWGLNGVYLMIDHANTTNITRWFEIHSLDSHKSAYQDDSFFKEIKCSLVMQEVFPDYPTSVKYPKDEILRKFPRKYFTNTVSWMIALAIYEGYTDISVYGVDMATNSEYANQRPSCEYFLGYAEGAGIKLHIPDESDLLKTPFLYGFECEKQDFIRKKLLARKAEYERKKAEFKQQIDQATAAMNTYDGALQDAEYVLGVWL